MHWFALKRWASLLKTLISKSEFTQIEERNRRQNRKKKETTGEAKAKSLVSKPKKVKPGYKKKMQYEMDKIKKRENRIQKRNK